MFIENTGFVPETSELSAGTLSLLCEHFFLCKEQSVCYISVFLSKSPLLLLISLFTYLLKYKQVYKLLFF